MGEGVTTTGENDGDKRSLKMIDVVGGLEKP